MGGVEQVEVVVAHQHCATLRVGDVFLKIDADQTRTDVEVEAMALAPIPTPEVLWRRPPVLALAAVPGATLGRLGGPASASSEAWTAAGAAVRRLHDAPLPPWPGRSVQEIASRLDGECEWLVANGVLPAELVARNRAIAQAALRPWTPVFTHGDLQIAHVFVDGDSVTGVIDWSGGQPGRRPVRPTSPTLTLGRTVRSALPTSSPATAPTSTSRSFARGGRCEAWGQFAGWSSTASTRSCRAARSTF